MAARLSRRSAATAYQAQGGVRGPRVMVSRRRAGRQQVRHLAGVVGDGLAADLQRPGQAHRLRLADLAPAHG